jgi:lysophospholipase L1-like esterase
MSRRKKTLIGAASFLALLIVLELFCRYYLGLGDPPLLRNDPEIGYLFIGPRTYHRFGNTITYNSFSMRSREFDAQRKDPNEIRILVVGDSVINGGVLMDQSQIMTTLLENRLGSQLHRPAIVMNVSAGGWGPPNYWAYIKHYGIFEANALIIVVSSNSAARAPTFEPLVGVDPDFPDKTPTFALSEALFRYGPRYLPHAAPPKPRLCSQGEFDRSMSALRELITFARERRTPVAVAQHLQQSEIGQPEYYGHRLIREACEQMNVERIELGPAFEESLNARKNPYRDDIHPNALGQQIMAEALEPVVLTLLARPNIVP